MNTNQAIARIRTRASWLSMLVLIAVAACSTNAQAVSTPTTIARLAATDIALATPSVTHGPPPTDTQAPTPDVRITQAYVATVLTARSAARATGDVVATQLAQVTLEMPTGIFDGGSDVFRYPNQDVDIQNVWQGGVANVYAGSRHSDPTQGLVLVMVEGPVMTYLSPVKAGSLRITAEQNLRLTLQSANGTTFYFDVPGQKFVSSLAAVVPTVTPYQSPTPAPSPVPPTAPPVPTCTPGPTPSHTSGESDCLATH